MGQPFRLEFCMDRGRVRVTVEGIQIQGPLLACNIN